MVIKHNNGFLSTKPFLGRHTGLRHLLGRLWIDLQKSAHFLPIREKNVPLDKLVTVVLEHDSARTRIPALFICDRDGKRFTSISGDHFTKLWVRIFVMSTAYHPETDGRAREPFKLTRTCFVCCVIDFGKGWVKHFAIAEFFI
ncbi:putative reverse transcriptase domain-containing protein [Tanacetum coccineum]